MSFNQSFPLNILFCAGIVGQSCIDVVDVNQQGANILSTSGLVIVPEYNFSCNGRITGYLIRLEGNANSTDLEYPSIQVWRSNSTIYNKVGTCILTADDIVNITKLENGSLYHLENMSCTGDNRTEFQSGDVIGYYQNNSSHYQLLNINATEGYTSYYSSKNSLLTSINISNVDYAYKSTQPLIQVMYGKVRMQHREHDIILLVL